MGLQICFKISRNFFYLWVWHIVDHIGYSRGQHNLSMLPLDFLIAVLTPYSYKLFVLFFHLFNYDVDSLGPEWSTIEYKYTEEWSGVCNCVLWIVRLHVPGQLSIYEWTLNPRTLILIQTKTKKKYNCNILQDKIYNIEICIFLFFNLFLTLI